VLFAIGREADTKLLNIEEVGVKVAKNGKIIVSDEDRTNSNNIFAIGDVC
jgi:pyruvate/2-oxoglutarate dehydrogenase complex dihydrolipoamide dehydrogenase (E3) component